MASSGGVESRCIASWKTWSSSAERDGGVVHNDSQLPVLLLLVHEGVLCIRLFTSGVGQGVHSGCHGHVVVQQDAGVLKCYVGPRTHCKTLVFGILIVPAYEIRKCAIKSVAKRYVSSQGRFEENLRRVVSVKIADELTCCVPRLFPGVHRTHSHHTSGPQVLCFQNLLFFDGRGLSCTHDAGRDRGRYPSLDIPAGSPTTRACYRRCSFPSFLRSSTAWPPHAARLDMAPSTARAVRSARVPSFPLACLRRHQSSDAALHLGRRRPLGRTFESSTPRRSSTPPSLRLKSTPFGERSLPKKEPFRRASALLHA